jgi:hypothetical protein
MHHGIPLLRGLLRINGGVADTLEVLRNLTAARKEQMPVAEFFQARTQTRRQAKALSSASQKRSNWRSRSPPILRRETGCAGQSKSALGVTLPLKTM